MLLDFCHRLHSRNVHPVDVARMEEEQMQFVQDLNLILSGCFTAQL